MLRYIIDILTKVSENKYPLFLYMELEEPIFTGLRKSVGCLDTMFMRLICQVMAILRVVVIKPSNLTAKVFYDGWMIFPSSVVL
jgi:hypothetical protein